MDTTLRPLDGITVVAMEHAIAAPFASRQLADMGARVIKIERPPAGDFAREYDTSLNGMSAFFAWVNRGKESIVLDIKDEDDRRFLTAMLSQADVFLQNLAPGAAARAGLDFTTLHAHCPALICCDISGYGEGGPFSERKAYDLLIQAASGLTSVTGTPEHPARAGISIADISAGMYAYSGILQAILLRQRTGKGSRVEVSMLESLAEWMSFPLYSAHYSGTLPERSGISHSAIAPYGQFLAGDGGHVVFGLQNDREWQRFCAVVMEDEALHQDSRFCTNVLRARNRESLEALITPKFSTMTRQQVTEKLDLAAIANSPLNDMHDLWNHAQLEARNRWREVKTPAGPMRALIPSATLTGVEPAMGAVPGLGEHTSALRREFAVCCTEAD
ncbi:CoA transferase [Advenella kashmirensis W13003]|uniref:CoA transferase n=1 Tax=Advenella kashmirensis W13003 TaxID=1424334 RepID=V8QYQ4_9BURK|nr:CaiB/BaiF CoA-transferase family protein [Advenella kashmirensis]ETF04460.1 CoA transferase [Advenella kashmirensis W13003]